MLQREFSPQVAVPNASCQPAEKNGKSHQAADFTPAVVDENVWDLNESKQNMKHVEAQLCLPYDCL